MPCLRDAWRSTIGNLKSQTKSSFDIAFAFAFIASSKVYVHFANIHISCAEAFLAEGYRTEILC